MTALLSPDQLEADLRAIGARLYHDQHPFHALLHHGKLDRGQVQAWALNRFEYQRCIPLKDAAILARMEDPALRRIWRQRILDHDGNSPSDGGIARWLHLTDALGLPRELVESGRALLPGTRFAVQAYLHFVRERACWKRSPLRSPNCLRPTSSASAWPACCSTTTLSRQKHWRISSTA